LGRDELSLVLNFDRQSIRQLTKSEQQDLLQLEKQVKTAFFLAGMALAQINQRKLFQGTHASFEDYCRDKFGYSRDYAYLIIGAAKIYQNLADNLPTNGRQLPLPTSERQLRPLVKARLAVGTQVEAWVESVEEADGGIPSGRIVKNVVQRIKDNDSRPNPFRVGEVCQIVARDNPELQGKGGTWGIISQIYEDSCRVDTWESGLVLPISHLKSLHYTKKQCRQMEEIGVRMSQLYETGLLEEAATGILKNLAKLKRSYLTSLEEKLLSCLEDEYLVK
jgi:hypothetical protein